MIRHALRTTLFALLTLTAMAAQAAPEKKATSADLLLASSRIDNFSIIVPGGKDWKALDSLPATKPSCASQLWTLFVDKDWIERPFASADGKWAVGIVAAQANEKQLSGWAAGNVAPEVALVVTSDYVICGPSADQARGLGVFTVGTKQQPEKKANGGVLPKELQLPGAASTQDLGFMQGFLFALKFWQAAPDSDSIVYLAGKYAGTAVLIIIAGIVAMFFIMFLIKKTIKAAIVLPFKIITWPIRCLFCRKKKHEED